MQNLTSIIENSMRETFRIHPLMDGILIQTHCFYRGGGVVRVVVRGSDDTFYVSDEGYGVGEIEAAGAHVEGADKLLRHLLKPMGLSSSGGIVKAPPCNAKMLGYAIASVANASALVADWLFSNMKVKQQNFEMDPIVLTMDPLTFQQIVSREHGLIRRAIDRGT